jgi:hypothetical protein
MNETVRRIGLIVAAVVELAGLVGVIFGFWAAWRIIEDESLWLAVALFVIGGFVASTGPTPLFAAAATYLHWRAGVAGPIWPIVGIGTAVAGVALKFALIIIEPQKPIEIENLSDRAPPATKS